MYFYIPPYFLINKHDILALGTFRMNKIFLSDKQIIKLTLVLEQFEEKIIDLEEMLPANYLTKNLLTSLHSFKIALLKYADVC